MRKTLRRHFIFLLALISSVSASTRLWYCMAQPVAGSESIKRLYSDLDRIFSDRKFAGGYWGVQVYSLDHSEILYARNPSRLFIPASNNKIITAAVALLRLGPDYRFRTLLGIDGPVVDGVLEGNLIVTGFGDPSITVEKPDEDPFRTFRHWAAILKEKGIRKITGDLIGDAGSFERTMFGQGWAWNDLTEGYAAPVSALQFNGNRLWIEIKPGRKRGSFVPIELKPLPHYWIVENKLIANTDAHEEKIVIERSGTDESIVLQGTLPGNSASITKAVAVHDPVRYYLSALKHVFDKEQIDVLTCGIRENRATDRKSPIPLWTHTSPPLSEILKPLLKESLNLHAETLTRVLGMELRGRGSFEAGKEVVEETLSRMAVDKDHYSFADGSGLSRRNLSSAQILVRVLSSLYRSSHFIHFYDALAIAGRDGTLENRLKGTTAENNIRAKTGTMSNISSISGYLKTADGEMLAFSILANNFLVPKSVVETAQDKALKILVGFSRK
ncbi:MAG: D-alanyl-D-alanine carboxypeptidase/D-alanyl-D-alanine-endopeptidase [Acidobacteria bacterium]|nr:D-alanyl-D-alanine carboxypeptidase/D-alanyl-D-alanine-endopeptidase [Acidobacteriota bacterium]